MCVYIYIFVQGSQSEKIATNTELFRSFEQLNISTTPFTTQKMYGALKIRNFCVQTGFDAKPDLN